MPKYLSVYDNFSPFRRLLAPNSEPDACSCRLTPAAAARNSELRVSDDDTYIFMRSSHHRSTTRTAVCFIAWRF